MKKCKVHSLIDKVYSRKNLELAWEKVKKNKRAAGVDEVTIARFEEHKDSCLDTLYRKLREDTYGPKPVRRTGIHKPDGRQRPLGVTVLEDKIVQRATARVLYAIYEVDFPGFSYGFRPGRARTRSPHHALNALYGGILTRLSAYDAQAGRTNECCAISRSGSTPEFWRMGRGM